MMKLNWQDVDRNKLPRSVKRALYIADGVIGYVANMPTASMHDGIRDFVRTYDFNGAYDPTCGPMNEDDQWEAELLVRDSDGEWTVAETRYIDPADYLTGANATPRSTGLPQLLFIEPVGDRSQI